MQYWKEDALLNAKSDYYMYLDLVKNNKMKEYENSLKEIENYYDSLIEMKTKEIQKSVSDSELSKSTNETLNTLTKKITRLRKLKRFMIFFAFVIFILFVNALSDEIPIGIPVLILGIINILGIVLIDNWINGFKEQKINQKNNYEIKIKHLIESCTLQLYEEKNNAIENLKEENPDCVKCAEFSENNICPACLISKINYDENENRNGLIYKCAFDGKICGKPKTNFDRLDRDKEPHFWWEWCPFDINCGRAAH